jgi:hypothetical protein
MAALIVALVVAALIAGCSGAAPPADAPAAGRMPAVRTLPLRPLVSQEAQAVRDRAHAVRFSLPPGWIRGRESLTPKLAPPGSNLLAVASFPPRAQPRRACGDWPDMPQAPIGPRDALLHVEEELDAQPGTKPSRPRELRLLEQLRIPHPDERVRSVFPWRCLNRRGIAGFRESFRAHGRLLHVTAIAGERSSRIRRRELLGVAESLRFGPTPPVPVRVAPATGGPHTRFRLELKSTHRTGRHGWQERDYRASVHGPRRFACVIETDAWFSHGPPGAVLHAELDPSRGNRWCRGRFSGVVRYRDAICSRPECERVYLRRAGSFSFTVR